MRNGMFRTVTIWAGNSLGRCTSQPAGRLDTTRGTVMACRPGASIIRQSHAADWWDAERPRDFRRKERSDEVLLRRLARAGEPKSLRTELYPFSGGKPVPQDVVADPDGV